MMATTQPEDIPQTIRSRCQHFSFHAVKFDDIVAQLRTIADAGRASTPTTPRSPCWPRPATAPCATRSPSWTRPSPARRLVDGKRRISTPTQIRELMGTVPNAVFERMLEAVDGNRSAEVMTEVNRLLNAGNSPRSSRASASATCATA